MKCDPSIAPCPRKQRRGVFAWLVPVLALVALPKCPLCVAAYAAWLGIGISVSTAAWLRFGIQLACVAALAVLALRLMLAVIRRRRG